MSLKNKCDIMLQHNIAKSQINVLGMTLISDKENLSNEFLFVYTLLLARRNSDENN